MAIRILMLPKSRNIRMAAYDADTQTLTVQYARAGHQYEHVGVPEQLIVGLEGADSPTAFLRSYIMPLSPGIQVLDTDGKIEAASDPVVAAAAPSTEVEKEKMPPDSSGGAPGGAGGAGGPNGSGGPGRPEDLGKLGVTEFTGGSAENDTGGAGIVGASGAVSEGTPSGINMLSQLGSESGIREGSWDELSNPNGVWLD